MALGSQCGCAMCGFCKKIGFINNKQDGSGENHCPKCGYSCQEHKCPECDNYHEKSGSCPKI